MGSTTIRSTVKTPVFVAYRCSSCGKTQYFGYELMTQASQTHMGNPPKRIREEMSAKAGEEAKEMMVELKSTIMREADDHVYASADIPFHPCISCGQTEAWMLPDLRRSAKASLAVTIGWIISLIAALVSCAINEGDAGNPFTKVCLALSAILLIAMIVVGQVRKGTTNSAKEKGKEMTRGLPVESLPVLSFDHLEFYAKTALRFKDDKELLDNLEKEYAAAIKANEKE